VAARARAYSVDGSAAGPASGRDSTQSKQGSQRAANR